jgi:hypothetical protein
MPFGIFAASLPSGLPDSQTNNDGRQCGGRRSEIRWKRSLRLGVALRRLAHLLGSVERRRGAKRSRTEEPGRVGALTRAGRRQGGHWSRSRGRSRRSRLGWLRMVMAALAGAGAVLAAAGALRAVLIVVAEVREFTPALVTPGALRAVPIVAALGANRVLGVPVLAADEPVAAVELLTAIPGAGNLQQTAGIADFPAAFIDRNACMAVAAGFVEVTEERMAHVVLTADLATVAILVLTAFRCGAPALFADGARACDVAVFVIAALGAVRAFSAFATALLVIRAFRDDGAEVVLTGHAGAECGYRLEAVTGVAALAAWVPGSVAADAVVEIDAHVAFAFLAFVAGGDAEATVAEGTTALAVLVATALGADTVAAATGFATEAFIRAEIGRRVGNPLARCDGTGIRQQTVIEHGFRRTGRLRAGAVEARGGDSHRGCPAE